MVSLQSENGYPLFTSQEEYTQYMVDHAADCIPVPTKTFQELNGFFRAPEKEEYTRDGIKGIQFFPGEIP